MVADELEPLRRSVDRLAARVIAPIAAELAHQDGPIVPDPVLRELRALGLFDLALEDDGLAALGVALAAIAEVSAAPATLLLAHAMAQRLAREAGAWPRIARLDGGAPLLGFAIYAEPLDPSDLACARDGDDLVLSGRARLVVNAPIADALILPVSSERGLAVVAVDARAPGVGIGPPLLTLGMRGAATADVAATAARLPADRLLAEGAAAEALLRDVTAWARGPAVAISAGILAASLRTGTAYARDRVQGGVPIVQHDAVRRMLADLAADLALCRVAAEKLSGARPPGEPEATLLFVRAKQRAARAACDGVQLLGGYGYMEDFGQERCLRDARQAQVLLGRCDLALLDSVEALP